MVRQGFVYAWWQRYSYIALLGLPRDTEVDVATQKQGKDYETPNDDVALLIVAQLVLFDPWLRIPVCGVSKQRLTGGHTYSPRSL